MPSEVRALGTSVVLGYMKMRKDLINNHNERVRQEVEEESDEIREITKGQSVITCRECGVEVHWGNIRAHRRGEMAAVVSQGSTSKYFKVIKNNVFFKFDKQ